MSHNSLNLQHHLLIAMPMLGDPNFEHAVSLVCQHDEYGAFGIIVNRPLDRTVGSLLNQLDIDVKDEYIANRPALSGGPAQVDQGFVLHDGQHQWENTFLISDNLALTSSRDILMAIANGEGPSHFLFVLGCAGWSAGQLENEIKENAWLTCPANNALLFEMPYQQRWHGAALTLGIDVNLLGIPAGHA